MTKSIKQVKVKDGKYKATQTGFCVTILRPQPIISESNPYGDYSDFKNGGLAMDVEVNRGLKGRNLRVSVDVIDGWVYVDLSKEDRRDLKLKKILE